MKTLLLLVLLTLLCCWPTSFVAANCSAKNFYNVVRHGSDADDVLIFGITQDCQVFFVKPSQLALLTRVHVDSRSSFCLPNLVQLHIKTHDALLLTIKQAGNRVCTLDVHIPPTEILFGDHLFSYSLLNSLPYAACSHTTDQNFLLEPDLSFLDPTFSNVIYMMDPTSTGKQWKAHQMLINARGNLNLINNFTIDNHALHTNQEAISQPASDFVVALDAQRQSLFKRNRFENIFDVQCAFDLLLRPAESEVNRFEAPARGYGTWMNSMASDSGLLIYLETDRTSNPAVSRLNLMNVSRPMDAFCLVSTKFAYDVGIVRASSLIKLRNEPLPEFGSKTTKPLSTRRPAKPKSANSFSTAAPTSARRLQSTTTSSATQTTSMPTGEFNVTESVDGADGGAGDVGVRENDVDGDDEEEDVSDADDGDKMDSVDSSEGEPVKVLPDDKEDKESGVGELRAHQNGSLASDAHRRSHRWSMCIAWMFFFLWPLIAALPGS